MEAQANFLKRTTLIILLDYRKLRVISTRRTRLEAFSSSLKSLKNTVDIWPYKVIYPFRLCLIPNYVGLIFLGTMLIFWDFWNEIYIVWDIIYVLQDKALPNIMLLFKHVNSNQANLHSKTWPISVQQKSLNALPNNDQVTIHINTQGQSIQYNLPSY